jgi:hypothetical protein
MRLPNTIAGVVSRYVDELYDAENFGDSAEVWFQEECKKRHASAARLWAGKFGMPYEEAYREFAKAVAKLYEHGTEEKIRVSESGHVLELREIWSAVAMGDHVSGADGVEVPEWVQQTPGVVIYGTAHLLYAYIEEEA